MRINNIHWAIGGQRLSLPRWAYADTEMTEHFPRVLRQPLWNFHSSAIGNIKTWVAHLLKLLDLEFLSSQVQLRICFKAPTAIKPEKKTNCEWKIKAQKPIESPKFILYYTRLSCAYSTVGQQKLLPWNELTYLALNVASSGLARFLLLWP